MVPRKRVGPQPARARGVPPALRCSGVAAAVLALVGGLGLSACSNNPADSIDYAVDGTLVTYNTNTVVGAASGGPQAFARVLTGFNRLIDVSPTWDPAYATTSAELRSMTSIAIDLQQLLVGEDQQLEDGAGTVDDPLVEERDSGAADFAEWKARMAAAKRERELSLETKGGHDDAS